MLKCLVKNILHPPHAATNTAGKCPDVSLKNAEFVAIKTAAKCPAVAKTTWFLSFGTGSKGGLKQVFGYHSTAIPSS